MNSKNNKYADKAFSNFGESGRSIPNFKYYNELGEEYAESFDDSLKKNEPANKRIRKDKNKKNL